MPIHLEDLTDLARLIAVLDLQKLASMTGVPLRVMPTDNLGSDPDATNWVPKSPAAIADDVRTLHQHLQSGAAAASTVPPAPAQTPDPEPNAAPVTATTDSTGLPWDGRIHSTPPSTNKDGSWRARRGVAPETVEAVTAELRAGAAAEEAAQRGAVAVVDTDPTPVPEAWPERAEPPTDGSAAEPVGVATETHALPVDTAPAAPANQGLADYTGLLARARATAGDASDSLHELLDASRTFISKYGQDVFAELKGAAAPLEGSAAGKMIPTLDPGERRFLRACLDDYPLFI